MLLRQNIINQIEQYLATEYLSIANVCFFMQSIRILIEIDQCQLKYKTVFHYCNWLLHMELNRSESPVIIKEITDSFTTFSSKNDLIKRINNSISLINLVVELKEILWMKISNKIVVSKIDFEEYWLNFIAIILNQIMHRPLKLRKKNILIENFNFTIYGIQIVLEKEYYCIELLSKELEEKDKKMIIDIAFFK
jgi:hypothetical protein